MSQLTMNFEPQLPDRFGSLRAYIAHRANEQRKPLKTIAADMDMSPSTLSRKLNPGDGDTQRFNLDDLEGYIQSTGDVQSVIEYLAAKYLDSQEVRRDRLVSQAERLLTELAKVLPSLKEAS